MIEPKFPFRQFFAFRLSALDAGGLFISPPPSYGVCQATENRVSSFSSF
jgi:hypothetical protein